MGGSAPTTLIHWPLDGGAVTPADLRILVVDDEADVREAVVSLLETFLDHPDVRQAGSGGEGLDELRRGKVDLIVTDFKMPGMDGAQFLREADKLFPGTPHIMVTAFDLEALQSLGPGVTARVVHKPFEPQALLDVVDDVLAAAGAA